MASDDRMTRLCRFYVDRAELIGFFYCTVPVLIWFGVVAALVRFRSVYAVRLTLSLVVGGPLAGYLNRFGLSLWLAKHGSPLGPGTVRDGALIGAGVGIGTALLPPLTGLIATNHPDLAKWFVILSWLAGVAIGAAIGSTLAAVGRRYVAPEAITPEGRLT